MEATLAINNPRIFDSWTRLLPTMLPAGATSNVVLPDKNDYFVYGHNSVKVQYKNQQDDLDPMNGQVVAGRMQLDQLLNGRRNNTPFLARLSGDNGFEIMVGVGGDVGCVQYSRSDGKPPYLVAVSNSPHMITGDVEFLTADTPTPIPARNILNFAEVKQVALHFLETGERSNAVRWETI